MPILARRWDSSANQRLSGINRMQKSPHLSRVQKQELLLWLEGWSLSLAEQNYLRTGYMTEGLLDVHLVTDSDIKNRTSYAVKIDAITDPALPLPMMESAQ